MLEDYLTSSEENTLIDNIIQSIEDNIRNPENLDTCNLVLSRFTYKAIQTNYSSEWLRIINKLIGTYEKTNKSVPSNIYLAKATCLAQFYTFDSKIEICLKKSISLSKSDLEKIEVLIRLAYYYDGIGKYTKMEKTLLYAESICQKDFSVHVNMADIWCALGCLKFITFNLNSALKYFQKSLRILNYLEEIDDNSIASMKFTKTFTTCLHYLGRIKLERYKFKECIDFYIQAEKKLSNFCNNNEITQDIGATAFYHLRLAQVLEICGVVNSADYHYQESVKLFDQKNPVPSGLSQVKLAISQQEKEVKESIHKNIEIGYSRGYLFACVKLFLIYCKSLKVHLALLLIFRVFCKLLTDKTIDFNYITILIKQIFLSSYGLGIYLKLKIIQLKLVKSDELLTACPCSDLGCKNHVKQKD
ncbi:hypothetical protein Pse7429DRAFT_1734 [Pseudanabaena biceps PCC 7429]|uniref:TPR repeat-containing protein n=1 Tax=Pseudanabaena biceps PCC 7429 TaxID=927668 RepID=L8N104_9CYAN|nr:hypothetical protein Pse7429DRAFT_1734 [Pseudanabaena biceps PCC 7429]